MTTREENLKKINEQLEQLSDEQLEQVAGGTRTQTIRDASFLNALLKGTADAPKRPDVHTMLLGIIRTRTASPDDVKKAWGVLGIDFTEHILGPTNDYVVKDTGEKLTQSQAWTYASKLLGRE